MCSSVLTKCRWQYIGSRRRCRRSSNSTWRARFAGRANPFVPTWQKVLASKSRSKAEFKRYIQMSIGSADEMRVWLRYCLDLGYTDEATWQRWRDEYEAIAKMLNGLHNAVD